MISRRSLLSGLIAAPAVIRVAPLMRIAPVPLVTLVHRSELLSYADGVARVRFWSEVTTYPTDCLYTELPSPLA